MAVSVVVEEAVAEPEQLVDTERIHDVRLDVGFCHRRIAVRAEQALARGDRRAAAVDFDRTAFEDHRNVERVETCGLPDCARNGKVRWKEVFLSPAVEAETYGGDFAGLARDKDRSRVAKPDVAVGNPVEACGKARERFGSVTFGVLARDEHFEKLGVRARAAGRRSDRAAEIGEFALRRLEIVLPEVGRGGPCQPYCAVALPLGRHAESRSLRAVNADIGPLRSDHVMHAAFMPVSRRALQTDTPALTRNRPARSHASTRRCPRESIVDHVNESNHAACAPVHARAHRL